MEISTIALCWYSLGWASAGIELVVASRAKPHVDMNITCNEVVLCLLLGAISFLIMLNDYIKAESNQYLWRRK